MAQSLKNANFEAFAYYAILIVEHKLIIFLNSSWFSLSPLLFSKKKFSIKKLEVLKSLFSPLRGVVFHCDL